MATEVTIKIAGEAGQGIQTIGLLLSEVCHRNGLFIFSVNHFESRIRGGHSLNILRISDHPIFAPSYDPDILVAINKKSYEREKENLPAKTVVILNTADTKESSDKVYPVSFEEIAEKAGGKIASNTVAAGIALSMLKAPLDSLLKVLETMFSPKGDKVLNLNIEAAKMGFEEGKRIDFNQSFKFNHVDEKRVFMSGAQAAALGAIASDCKFFSFYPMSPSTNIFTSAASYTDDFPIVVEQAEDEIAAVNMAIGASFAGVRSLTATSGGGFCLMTEGLGLAAMTETPLVVINAQRPGPATGLPTRTAQGDLLFTVHASQDEFPRFVFAPGSVLETFSTLKRAFLLSEKYQVPAIVLMDQFLCDSIMTEKGQFDFTNDNDHWYSTTENGEDNDKYMRYAFTHNGISPRIIPCSSKALVRSTANEHDQKGHISEDAENRVRMVNKRGKKISLMLNEIEPPYTVNPKSAFLLAGWGSTKGSILEACVNLRNEGFDVGALIFNDIWPMDSQEVSGIIEGKKLIMIEQNSTCQMGQLICQKTGISFFESILKYDGRPIYPQYITDRAKEIMEH